MMRRVCVWVGAFVLSFPFLVLLYLLGMLLPDYLVWIALALFAGFAAWLWFRKRTPVPGGLESSFSRTAVSKEGLL